jgi:hypothetical protein
MNIKHMLSLFCRGARCASSRGRIATLLAVVLLGSLLLVSIVLAAPESYEILWSTVDGGGGSSSNGIYSLKGTIGQPDAGAMSNGEYKLAGGFWAGAATASEYEIYIPLVKSNYAPPTAYTE